MPETGSRPRCSAGVTYRTANSTRELPSGEPRFMSALPDQCRNPASFTDVDGDPWCAMHARRAGPDSCYAPFTPIDASRHDPIGSRAPPHGGGGR